VKANPPDLESLRRQLGEAILEPRLAEARRREQMVRRLEAARAAGVGLPQAARTLEIPHAIETLRAWTGRWLSFGLAGLVEMRGPPHRSAEARGRPGARQAQLALSGVLEGAPRPRPRGRSPGNRVGAPASLLKWPGSKAPIASKLIALAPVSFERYHEPFLGDGSLFFALRPAKAFGGDVNAELVNLYRTVRDEPGALVEAMARHQDSETGGGTQPGSW
jgi:hypothetical protein